LRREFPEAATKYKRAKSSDFAITASSSKLSAYKTTASYEEVVDSKGFLVAVRRHDIQHCIEQIRNKENICISVVTKQNFA